MQRSREGRLARLAVRASSADAESSAAAATTERLMKLLGVGSARAAEGDVQAPIAGNPALAGALGLADDPRALLDHRYLWDAQGNLLFTRSKADLASYAYDLRDRLIVAHSAAQTSRYHYDAAGRRVLEQQDIADQADLTTNTQRVAYQTGTHRWMGKAAAATSYDANGQPMRLGRRDYVWDALGKLVAVRQDGEAVARYTYNHRGERVRKQVGDQVTEYLYQDGQLRGELNAQGKVTRQYVYLDQRPIALIDTAEGKTLDIQSGSSVARIGRDLVAVVDSWLDRSGSLVWLHTNHLGAVEAATDGHREVIWRASFTPSGRMTPSGRESQAGSQAGSQHLALNLRLPGQYEDQETGLHYNGQRYYDPSRGEYLTPDPLGTPDGPNGYAYVRGNALKYVDPDGLILFAFDGTGNDESNPDTLSNVVNFRNIYASDGRRVDYVTGVGTRHRDPTYGDISYGGGNTLDSGFNYTGPDRIVRMTQYFNDRADKQTDDDAAIDVDIIGFSRGAAQARDFSNRIASHTTNGYYKYTVKDAKGNDLARCQKVNFRFLGLWDTVLSTNRSGTAYNLAIPEAFSYVAHAVALNEYRGSGFSFRPAGSIGAFPLESIMDGMYSPTPMAGKTRIERGFLGSHSDIGGGFEQGGLAVISLNWMVNQARAAGVQMDDAPNTIAANPVLHDKSDAQRYGEPRSNTEDRTVRYRNGQTTTQREMTLSAGMSYSDTNQFISYGARYGANYVTGTVDARAYVEWLGAHGYGISVAAP